MQIDFKGKRVVVAGGSRGIGRSIALGFAEAGAAVSICARGADGLAATEAELAKFGNKTHSLPTDLGNEAEIVRYIAAAAEALGGIDVLVNNASGFGRSDDAAGWAVSVAVDVMAIVHASNAAIPHMEKAGGGAIVNISSISAMRPSTRNPPYGAVKAAVVHYTMTQAANLAAKNIRVNCVAPGSIEFPGGSWEKRRSDNPELYNNTLKSIRFGRFGTPEEIAHVTVFLASPFASWVTGQTLSVDGGQLLH